LCTAARYRTKRSIERDKIQTKSRRIVSPKHRKIQNSETLFRCFCWISLGEFSLLVFLSRWLLLVRPLFSNKFPLLFSLFLSQRSEGVNVQWKFSKTMRRGIFYSFAAGRTPYSPFQSSFAHKSTLIKKRAPFLAPENFWTIVSISVKCFTFLGNATRNLGFDHFLKTR
jgi:hypothetical protein